LLCNIKAVIFKLSDAPAAARCGANTAKEHGLPQPGMKSRPPKGASGEVAPGIAPIDPDAAAFCGSEGSGARPPLIPIES
jgi:hypothetical protein